MSMTRNDLLELVERIGGILRSEQRKSELEVALQPVHHQVLRYLARCNRYSNTPAAVADYLGSTKGTVSQTLNVLERNDLVEKRTDGKDRRVVHVLLTDKGRKLVAGNEARQVLDSAVTALGNGEIAGATDVLKRLLRQMQQANDFKTFEQCRTCRHLLREQGGRFRCGLTHESLEPDETLQICHEHAFEA
ncbi:MAG TPA: MarR family winged helix-turn-helix transcriptional regulator [Gammaproteobacteria bacterium]|nr:MarR family winged helix-turn-helix transcriptional regulator [Gammaproteobacteria bacterium]